MKPYIGKRCLHIGCFRKYESLLSQWNRTLWNVFYGFVAMFTVRARAHTHTRTSMSFYLDSVRWHFVDIHQTNFTNKKKIHRDTKKTPLLNISDACGALSEHKFFLIFSAKRQIMTNCLFSVSSYSL